jgi:hypothetical protein
MKGDSRRGRSRSRGRNKPAEAAQNNNNNGSAKRLVSRVESIRNFLTAGGQQHQQQQQQQQPRVPQQQAFLPTPDLFPLALHPFVAFEPMRGCSCRPTMGFGHAHAHHAHHRRSKSTERLNLVAASGGGCYLVPAFAPDGLR